jgi:streptomycin 6-kinase
MTLMESWSLPENLVDAAHGDGRQWWLSTLPEVVGRLEKRWGLRVGPPFEPGGTNAWVAPARDADGVEVVLKVGWRHAEAAHEADGLRQWGGDGAVEVYAAEEGEATMALLLERCVPGTSLGLRPEPEQDIVIAGLLRRLWREPTAGHRFRPLEVMCDAWADEFEEKAALGRVSLDPGLARQAMALLQELPRSPVPSALLVTDLHADNVLAAEREPWLVIDPKPYIGDPAYDVIQHLLNCRQRLGTAPRELARRMADLSEVDGERVLLWLFARCVQKAPDWEGLADVARALAPS